MRRCYPRPEFQDRIRHRINIEACLHLKNRSNRSKGSSGCNCFSRLGLFVQIQSGSAVQMVRRARHERIIFNRCPSTCFAALRTGARSSFMKKQPFQRFQSFHAVPRGQLDGVQKFNPSTIRPKPFQTFQQFQSFQLSSDLESEGHSPRRTSTFRQFPKNVEINMRRFQWCDHIRVVR